MKSTGIVRTVDSVGRFVIPMELRRTLNIIDNEDALEVFVDVEPLSPMTNTYNEALRRRLSSAGLEFREIERKEVDAIPISASEVRRLIKVRNRRSLRNTVPSTTMKYMQANDLM